MSNIMRKIVILHRQKQRSEILSYTVPSLASMVLLHPKFQDYPFFVAFQPSCVGPSREASKKMIFHAKLLKL